MNGERRRETVCVMKTVGNTIETNKVNFIVLIIV